MDAELSLALAAAIRSAGGVTEADVDWDLKSPSSDCPFRKPTPYHGGVASRALLYAEQIRCGRFAHTCHKTDKRSDSETGKAYQGRPKVCAGSLYMLVKTGEGADLQRAVLNAIDAGKLDIKDLDRRARAGRDCYAVREFIEACAAGLASEIEAGEPEGGGG